MQNRKFGRTGEEVSILGLGGFHLLEVSDRDACNLINVFIDEGGNYVETAAQYGEGESERKVGLMMPEKRKQVFLVTKCHLRDKKGAQKCIEQSLKRLKTDYVDLLLLHHVQEKEELEEIFSPSGAIEAFEKAKNSGMTRYTGITGHGVPDVLIEALHSFEFDALMTGVNFFDRFNFPRIEEELLPLAVEKNVAVVGMKALADGLLWEYPEESIRYALSLPLATLACGFNTMEMMNRDIEIARNFKPLSEEEKKALYDKNPVLGNYVCRLCDKCLPCPEGINIPEVFLYEGWYDRQLRDRVIREAPEFALRDRLRFWFDNREKAKAAYRNLSVKADACTACRECIPKCPYEIDIIAKLDNAHYKLTKEATATIPV